MSDDVYFISGGGTGGHIYPAFTIVDELLKDKTPKKIYFVGNPHNLECDIVKGYPEVEFLPVIVTGMPRKITFSLFSWAVQLFKAYIKALGYIKKYKPNAIFTTGGYVSAPIVFAAKTLNKPYMIHDCDSVPGMVSKLAASGAKIVSVAFENSKDILKSKNIIVNGNPVREAFFTISKERARSYLKVVHYRHVLFAMGGSQGAKTINDAMINIIKYLVEEMDLFVILQTGKKNYDEVVEKLESVYPGFKYNDNIIARPYFDEMVYPLKAADLVIARAGSVSLTEILQCHAASILIPYPYAAQDHQRKNAKEICAKGAALYLEDSDCSSENLLSKIKETLSNESRLFQMQEKAALAAKNNPAKDIVQQLNSIKK
ncbi:MAG: undecaprenyldiphospho-muramoylpentapeptide beta-N-acetylglucosaminyltransferase [Candidatus Gastranaerophilales bacterium]|nr:undecaprenyldiphospho-muramoylpentapeptide beta-N-acetylglucosaminyltransferase [Candidatus Gastranaerophilales bacterium]